MVQDAVTAALSHTGARNYTVVQLPTVYTNENGETSQQRTAEAITSEEQPVELQVMLVVKPQLLL